MPFFLILCWLCWNPLLPELPKSPNGWVKPVVVADDPDLARIFAAEQITGTMVITKLDGSRRYVYNAERAGRRLPAASTFKIFNSLIALEERVIAGADDVFKWDGTKHWMEDWNRDQTLRSAYKLSCVWCYQELARRIGPERYRVHLGRAKYGHLDQRFELTTFWLDGSFQVSALEQVEFLRKVIERKLPYRADSYDTLRQIMLMEEGEGYALRAKTGWATRIDPDVGWYVGYVERADGVWIFALNMEVRSDGDLPTRLRLARAGLQAKGILPRK
jgi:beta-lactamase class D